VFPEGKLGVPPRDHDEVVHGQPGVPGNPPVAEGPGSRQSVHPYIPNGAGRVLPLVPPPQLPPLLFTATLRTTAGRSRDAAGRVLLLAVGLTVATAAAVGRGGSIGSDRVPLPAGEGLRLAC
jgi:hypothetical protein